MGEESLTERVEKVYKQLLRHIHSSENKGYDCPIYLGVLFNLCHDSDTDPRALIEKLYVEKMEKAVDAGLSVMLKAFVYGFASGARATHIGTIEHCIICNNNQICSTSINEYRDKLYSD